MDHNDSVFFMGPSGPSSNLLLDQLPSYQSLLYRRKPSVAGSSRRRSGQRTRLGSSSSWKLKGERLEERPKVAPLQRHARELPLSMVEKRRHKERHMETEKELVGWEQWWQGTRHSLKRLREEGGHLLMALQLWRTDIHVIEGMFGTGIRSYFSFLRFLVLLNFVIFLLMFGFVMLPIIAVPHASGNITSNLDNEKTCSDYPSTSRQGLVVFHQYISDLLSGTGFLEETYLFYGYYKVDSINFPKFSYNLPLAYILITVAYLFLSLIWIVKRSAAGFKQNLIQDEELFQSFCNKIFAGWDFCITNANAARLKRSSLLYELKTDLEEERIKQKIAGRTRKEKCRIYTIRLALNIFVVSVLAACFYCIYRATIYSQESQLKHQIFILELLSEYLPSIVITLGNFITPLIFSLIIQYEDYSPAFEIRFTLMRCVFMRLASIGVLLFSLWSQITCRDASCPCGYNHELYPCWESRVGQEMYKLMIFDFLIIGATTLFVEFPRKLLVTHCEHGLAKWWGQQEFAIPNNVLEIVYGQTICWIGTFYCPLLPAISTIKYFIIFYIKKLTLIHNCRPATRPFRASSSNFFFLGVLLIGLTMAYIPIIASFAQISCSQACGPFVGFKTSWEVVPRSVDQLPYGITIFLKGLASEASAVCFFVITCLAMFYVIALARAHKCVIHQLREQLAMEARDKRFLIEKLLQAQRSAARFRGGTSSSSSGLYGPRSSTSQGLCLLEPPVSTTNV
uniref:Transmembrane channel-like protein n=1 Tax=Paramormyrops kingsleyae TaxID=1676925 RepID=A0A3B3SDM4_9TELE|nr:transmembrane channel-like protein 7 isoform X1 [Paramormyrops kingsleyae]